MNINQDMRNIFDSLYDGILIIDKLGIVKYINPSYTRITKLKENEIINKKLLDIRKDSHLTEVMKTGKKKIGLYRTIEDIKYLVNMVPIFDNGQIIGGISVVNDMHDIQATLDKTQAMLETLKEKMENLNKNKINFEAIISIDKNSIDTKKYAKRIAKSDSNILISGETGTGKELYASAIHSESLRANFPFVILNCASLDKEELEKELFGYEDENSKKNKVGILQLIENGTLFLDEISELDYSTQNKLLKTLQNMTIRKVGSFREIPVNFRLISASNRDLQELVSEGKFRKDLYYKISVLPLKIPPLKNRRGDILVLMKDFLEELNVKYRKDILLSEEVKEILLNYDWPGNIRELKNIIEFLFNTVEGNIISSDDIPEYIQVKRKIENIKNLSEYTKEIEKKYIKRVLKNFEDNLEGKKKAAESLGISLATLYNKLS
ncbi:MAG: sigma 54-interacting transcriptional regulator [Fusobacterium sp.]|nr:sigma 54-interacting transcriptional regulator [Fusobacterium sp.]